MPRRTRNRFRTTAPREITLIIAVVLWLIGFAAVILGAIDLPNNLGVWSLALAGLLLILGSLIEGI
ncbi:MAG: hypothetical protein A2029_14635 [Chloroflexi bacterium RBG_19FT_COMBO_47_9]|nr:MAG: hypothetical protein A2029_14635 [Chloroflexi bacterium RBG_19FT_COMBO_47_9]